jgi:hypothetical protein
MQVVESLWTKIFKGKYHMVPWQPVLQWTGKHMRVASRSYELVNILVKQFKAQITDGISLDAQSRERSIILAHPVCCQQGPSEDST